MQIVRINFAYKRKTLKSGVEPNKQDVSNLK